MTKTKFAVEVRLILDEVGVSSSLFADHSFRLGAASMVAAVGLEDSTIRALVRWKSGLI